MFVLLSAQVWVVQQKLVYLIPCHGIRCLAGTYDAERFQLGSNTGTIVLCAPYVWVFGHTLQVTSYAGISVGAYGYRFSQRVAHQLCIVYRTSDTCACESLYAVFLHVEHEVFGDIHLQAGIDHRNITLCIPVVQAVE